MSESCAVLEAISKCHSDPAVAGEESRINLAPILRQFGDLFCCKGYPWRSRRRNTESKKTAMGSIARIIAR
jgi:hypothetical protein